jgi:hypothetical protein
LTKAYQEMGVEECQELDRCDAGAGRSEKPGGVHRIAAAVNRRLS